MSFGLTARQSRGIEYLCDELLLPLLRSDKNGGHHAVIQVIAGENTADYQVILQFPTLAADPLESDILDEMGRKIVSAFTKSLKSEKMRKACGKFMRNYKSHRTCKTENNI